MLNSVIISLYKLMYISVYAHDTMWPASLRLNLGSTHVFSQNKIYLNLQLSI